MNIYLELVVNCGVEPLLPVMSRITKFLPVPRGTKFVIRRGLASNRAAVTLYHQFHYNSLPAIASNTI